MKKIIIALLAIVCVSCQTAVQDNPLKDKIILFVYGGWDGHQPKQCHDFLKPWLEEQGAIVYSSQSLNSYIDKELMGKVDLIIQNYSQVLDQLVIPTYLSPGYLRLLQVLKVNIILHQ